MATFWKRKDRDIWIVDYRDATGKRTRIVGGATREEAELTFSRRKVQEVETRKDEADRAKNPDHDLTLNTYAARWLATRQRSLAQRTYRSYATLYRLHIQPTLGAMKLRDIRPLHIADLLDEKRLTLGKNTVRLIKATLSTMLWRAAKVGMIAANPALGRLQEGDQPDPSPEVRSMSHDQLTQFKETMDAMRRDGRLDLRWVVLFATMAGTGLRPSETLALQPGDLDLAHQRIRIERALDADGSVKPTKTKLARVVDLSDTLTAALRDYVSWLTVEAMATGREPAWLFRGQSGTLLTDSDVRPVFARILRNAALPHFIPYDLRHTYASLLLSGNVPLLYVSAQLGHAKPTTTLKHYAKWVPREDTRYVNLLEGSDSWHQTLAPKPQVLDTSDKHHDSLLIKHQHIQIGGSQLDVVGGIE